METDRSWEGRRDRGENQKSLSRFRKKKVGKLERIKLMRSEKIRRKIRKKIRRGKFGGSQKR